MWPTRPGTGVEANPNIRSTAALAAARNDSSERAAHNDTMAITTPPTAPPNSVSIPSRSDSASLSAWKWRRRSTR